MFITNNKVIALVLCATMVALTGCGKNHVNTYKEVTNKIAEKEFDDKEKENIIEEEVTIPVDDVYTVEAEESEIPEEPGLASMEYWESKRAVGEISAEDFQTMVNAGMSLNDAYKLMRWSKIFDGYAIPECKFVDDTVECNGYSFGPDVTSKFNKAATVIMWHPYAGVYGGEPWTLVECRPAHEAFNDELDIKLVGATEDEVIRFYYSPSLDKVTGEP